MGAILDFLDMVKEAFILVYEGALEMLFNIRYSLSIFWKGLLAIFIDLGVIMVVTMLLNLVINKIESKKKLKK